MPIIKGQIEPDLKLLPSNKLESLSPLLLTLSKLRENLAQKTPYEIVQDVINYYKPILKDKYDDFVKREKDLAHFEYLAEQYSNTTLLSHLAVA